MRRLLPVLVGLLGETVGEAVFEGLLTAILAGPLWLLNHVFGPFNPDHVVLVLTVTLAALGFLVFVAIGVSRHPEAWKVRLFGAIIAGVFAVEVLYLVLVRKHHWA